MCYKMLPMLMEVNWLFMASFLGVTRGFVHTSLASSLPSEAWGHVPGLSGLALSLPEGV